MEAAEDSFRRYMEVPDNFEVLSCAPGEELTFLALTLSTGALF